MNYRIGDKIKIKTWSMMTTEFGLDPTHYFINCYGLYSPKQEKCLEEVTPDRILTIKEIVRDYYRVEELGFDWTEQMIDGLAKNSEKEILDPILTRFEILDIRD